MQETLLAELSTTRRVRLHGQVGEALEKRYGAHAEERAGRLAMHFSEAATLSPRFGEKAAKYSAIAGRQALAQSAYPEAARHFRAALSAREGAGDGRRDGGAAARASARPPGATPTWLNRGGAFDRRSTTSPASGNVARAAEVAYEAGTSMLLIRPSQVQLIERALALVEVGSEAVRQAERRARTICRNDGPVSARGRRSLAPRRSRSSWAAAAGAGRAAVQPVRDRFPARAGGSRRER